MKVCQLCAVDFTLKHFLLPLIDGMRNEGWDVVAVCSDGPSVASLRSCGYRIETVPIARSLSPLAALRALVSLTALFHRERFDVLHVHTPVAALVGRIAARLVGIPLVIYTAHGFYFHDEMPWWKRALFVALERFGGRFTDFLLTQSEEDARAAVTERIAPPNHVMAIGNGVDVARFNPANVPDQMALKQALGIAADGYVVGMVGRLVHEKGVAEFLEAARRLASRYPQAWFVLVGERLLSDHAGDVEADIRLARAALGDRLVLTGLRHDIPELMATMDLFCLPSWREGMPRTIIEAMMMGRPVVATDIRGAREEIVPEQTGLLVPTRAPQELAAAISRFIDDPEWGRSLGWAGRVRALLLYDEQHIVRLQLDRIHSLAKAQGQCF